MEASNRDAWGTHMWQHRWLTIASAIAFVLITISLWFWPFGEKYREIGADVYGCFVADGAGQIVISPKAVTVTSNGVRLSSTAKEGTDKIGRYILTNPGILWERLGNARRPKSTAPAKSFRADSTNELWAYADDGTRLSFQRHPCDALSLQ